MIVLGFVLSVAIGVSLGFFGGGGSILTVPLLVYVFGLEPKTAIASSLLIVALASASGMLQHWRRGNVVWRKGLVFGLAGMAGAYVGGRSGAYVDGSLLLLFFALMMAVTAFAMWRGRRIPATSDDARSSPLRLAVQGFSVGVFTGLVGAGGGFLIVPALALWAGLPMTTAVGTSLLIIVLNTLAGFAGYSAHVRIDPALVGGIAAAAIAGSFVGSRLAHRVDPFSLRRAFAGFVAVMACFVLVREGQGALRTVIEDTPEAVIQIVAALALLAIGMRLGEHRAGRAARARASSETFYEGAGI